MNISIHDLINFILKKYNLSNNTNYTELNEKLNYKLINNDKKPGYILISKSLSGNHLTINDDKTKYISFDGQSEFDITIDLVDNKGNIAKTINIQAEIIDYLNKSLSQTIFLFKALIEGEILTTKVLQQNVLNYDPKILFTTNKRNAHMFALPYPDMFFCILNNFMTYAKGKDSSFIKEVTDILQVKSTVSEGIFYEIINLLNTLRENIVNQQFDEDFSVACTRFYNKLCACLNGRNFTVEQLSLLEDIIQYTQSIIKENQRLKYSNLNRDLRYINSNEFIKTAFLLMKNSKVSFKNGEVDEFKKFISKKIKQLKYEIDLKNNLIDNELEIAFNTIIDIQNIITLLKTDSDIIDNIKIELLDVKIDDCNYSDWIYKVKTIFNKEINEKIHNNSVCILDYISCLDKNDEAVKIIIEILNFCFKEKVDEKKKQSNNNVYTKIDNVLSTGILTDVDDEFESNLLAIISTYMDMSKIEAIAQSKIKNNDFSLDSFTSAIIQPILSAYNNNTESIELHYEFIEGQKNKYKNINSKVVSQILNKYEQFLLNDTLMYQYFDEIIKMAKEATTSPQNYDPNKLKQNLNAIINNIKFDKKYNVFYKSLLQYIKILVEYIIIQVDKVRNNKIASLLTVGKQIQEIDKLISFENNFVILSKLNEVKLELQFKSSVLTALELNNDTIRIKPEYRYLPSNSSNDSINYLALLYKLLNDKTLIKYYEHNPKYIINFAKVFSKIPNIRLLCLIPCTNIIYSIGPRTTNNGLNICLKIEQNALVELVKQNDNGDFIVISLKSVDKFCDFDISTENGKIHDDCILYGLIPLAALPGSALEQYIETNRNNTLYGNTKPKTK